jgi:MFS transporter, PAT family, beta-lactamase induction signal transducer AmpG
METPEISARAVSAAAPLTRLLVSRAPHPVVWTVLYLPFGALGGFVSVALTFLATQHGLSISEGALLNGAQLLTQWLKWIWAPLVDITLSRRKWYVISTSLSAVGVLAMSAVPLGPGTLGILLVVIALASLINSVVGMSVEAIIAGATPPDQIGRVSAWFQAGNLGGTGLGGGLGLLLLEKLPKPWMSGAIMGALFMLCCLALRFTPDVAAQAKLAGKLAAVKRVTRDLWAMLKTKSGLLAAVLCVLPVGTGAAQGTLTQAKVAAFWGAGANQVALMQGLFAGLITAVGCFAGGYLCQRLHPRIAYSGIGLALAAVAVLMGVCPSTVSMYVVWSLVYAFAVGLAYAAFTALVLASIGKGSAATKYNVFASLANFPLWWLGLLLGVAADKWGARAMLLTEATFGVAGVIVFAYSIRLVGRSKLAA